MLEAVGGEEGRERRVRVGGGLIALSTCSRGEGASLACRTLDGVEEECWKGNQERCRRGTPGGAGGWERNQEGLGVGKGEVVAIQPPVERK